MIRKIFTFFTMIILLLSSTISIMALSDVKINSGASIRTSGNQGLKFSATVSNLTDSVEHGFYLVIGECIQEDFISSIDDGSFLINNNKVLKVEVKGTNDTFSVVVYNIPKSSYKTKITAISYVKYQDVVEYSTDVITRSIFDVAYNAYLEGNREKFITDIFNTYYADVTYNLNYSYQSLDKLCSDFLCDFNNYANTLITKDSLNEIDKDMLVNFMSISSYKDKWNWFFEKIVSSRIKYEDEIENYATNNYNGYITDHNKNYYTPYLKRLIKGEDGLYSGRILWVYEIDALFNKKAINYYNAHTLDWSSDYANNIVNELLNPSFNVILDTKSDITYNVSRDNYEFLGWYNALDEKVDIAEGNIEVYAKWKDLSKVIYVDDDWKDYQEGQEVVVNGFTYTYGVDAFSNINDAICSELNLEIVVLEGSYNENIVINKDNISLYGANNKISSDRNNETIINGSITINSGTKDLYIGGFMFNESSFITNEVGISGTDDNPSYNIERFEFSYNNIITSLNGSSFISFSESLKCYSKDIVITNNNFRIEDGATISSFIKLDNVYNLELLDNTFIGNIDYAIYIDDTSKGLSGDLINIERNYFSDININALNIDWLSPINNINSIVNINDNSFYNILGNCIFLGNYNNTDQYKQIKICDNYFENYKNGIYISRCTKLGNYSISNNIFGTEPNGYYVVSSNIGTTNPSTLYLVNNLYFSSDEIVSFNSSLISGDIENDYLKLVSIEGKTTLEIGEKIKINTNVDNNELVWTSSNNRIATVNEEGEVSTHKVGNVHIYATYTNGGILDIGLTVYDRNKVSELMQLLIDNNHDEILNQEVLYIGYEGVNYPNIVNGSANNYWAGSNPEVIDMMLPTDRDNYSGVTIPSLEYITFHDTGSSGKGQTAYATGKWCTNANNTESSWHYSVGNDGIYHHLPDTIVGWHAGDGRNATKLYNTGIKASDDLRHRPVVTIGDDGYYYLDGVKSEDIAKSGTNSSTLINKLGLACVIKDGYYYIPNTWYSPSYSNALSAYGGNYNSIGIESCVNNGSNLWLTWQYSAKLIAKLLVENDLGPDRVLFHNNFSNKICPNTMIVAELTEEFLDLVYMEYYIAKYFSDYTITFSSSNTNLLDNTGNVLNNPEVKTSVQYTITISNGIDIEKITLNTIVLPNN